MDTRPLILTHNDLDGWCAGAIALGGWPDAEVRHVQYGMPCPVEDARGRMVAVLDFSWPPDDMVRLVLAAARVVWVDHHPGPVETAGAVGEALAIAGLSREQLGQRLDATLSVAHCGAWLAWERLGTPRPWIVDLVDDHDRWVHYHPDTRPVVAALHALIGDAGSTWGGWGVLLDCTGIDAVPLDGARPEHVQRERDRLVDRGSLLLADRAVRVTKAVRQAFATTVDGHPALVVNAAPDITSDLGHALCQQPGCEVAVVWSVGLQGGMPRVFFSLRSAEGGPTVNDICKRRGGGGHPHAAGWTDDLAFGLAKVANEGFDFPWDGEWVAVADMESAQTGQE